MGLHVLLSNGTNCFAWHLPGDEDNVKGADSASLSRSGDGDNRAI